MPAAAIGKTAAALVGIVTFAVVAMLPLLTHMASLLVATVTLRWFACRNVVILGSVVIIVPAVDSPAAPTLLIGHKSTAHILGHLLTTRTLHVIVYLCLTP